MTPSSVQASKPLGQLRVLVVDVDSARAGRLVQRLCALGCDAKTATQRSHWMEFRPQLTFVVEGALQPAALAALANAVRRVAEHPQRLVCIVASGAGGVGLAAIGFDAALQDPSDAALRAQMQAVRNAESARGDVTAGLAATPASRLRNPIRPVQSMASIASPNEWSCETMNRSTSAPVVSSNNGPAPVFSR